MAEEDRVDISKEVNPPAPAHSQPPPTHAPPPPTPAGMLLAYSGAPPTHLQPPMSLGVPLARTSQTSSASDDQARIAALEGTVNQMATNMAELLALLRGPNRASSSSTPPPRQGPTADPTPWVPPTQAPENMEVPAPPTLHTSVAHPFTSSYPPPPAPTAVSLPLATFLSSEQVLPAPPPISIPVPAMAYTAPPPMVFPAPTPPTLLELSTKEMARGQRFEEYATKWRARAAKHIPPISEAQQIQLFHSTLRGVYYSHLLAHTSSFSDLIEAGKKLDFGIKLGRMEDPASRGEESSKKIPATPSSFGGKRGKESKHCEYHQGAQGHTLNNCWRLRDEIQRRIDSNRLTFNAVRPPNVQANPLPDHRPSSRPSINMIAVCVSGRDEDAQDDLLPIVIDYTPREPTVEFTGHVPSPAPFVVDIPAREPYSDSKQFSVMGVTHSRRVYENPAVRDKGKAPAVEVGAAPESSPFPSKKVTEEEVEAFMKIVKASEYKVVDQMAKSPAHISLLTLLLGSEPHREAFLRVLTSAQVPKGTPPDRIEETVGSIFSNTISFSDDELPSEGWSHSRALHIVCKCNNYIIGRVMIDNGSAFNVCPVTTLKQMNVDLNRVRPSKTTVRAFDGSRREMNGEIDLFIDVGPCSFSITFQVLLLNNYVPGTGLGARGQGISRPIKVEEYKRRRGLGFSPSCHEIIEARRGHHLHRLATYYGRLNRDSPVPPLSHFFPEPSHTIGGTLDGPSSDSDDTPAAPKMRSLTTGPQSHATRL
ncbi:hypothetical protein CRG98_010109 [Punica granatum]|uniref:G-patch domain-containing protein n=1 Tax=Punica granatum TaxID=22663 RepID=A0A2I0KLY8_PUNGR|nr:hypothetical protein CRG98_010109 [Punica granatum]